MRLAFWNTVLFAVHLEITLLYPEMELFLFGPGRLQAHITLALVRNEWILQDILLLSGDCLENINSDCNVNFIPNSQAYHSIRIS